MRFQLCRCPCIILSRLFSNETARRTPLYDFHLSQKARMVDFCNYIMPLQYSDQSIIDSHHFVRQHCGLFDVSHMLQMQVFGNDRVNFLESLTCADINGLSSSVGTLSVFLLDNGGILDDTIIMKCKEPYLYVVSNAACSSKIQAHVTKMMIKCIESGQQVELEVLKNALLALQGPDAYSVLRSGISPTDVQNFENLYFMESMLVDSLFGFKTSGSGIRLTRCGYTGEDGYEISIPSEIAIPIAEILVRHSCVKPVGLAARDTLRLEAGLCLYGNDISEETTPVEASLSWLISKQRRLGRDPKFPGYSVIINQLKNKNEVKHKRIGLIYESGPPARRGSKIFDQSMQLEIGTVTSGCFSPTLNTNIGMAYVKSEFGENGRQLFVQIRHKFYPCIITKMPFITTKYVRRC
ncbi:hypothetical protein MN116_003935 [Schistosoma mekongi]|uniref:Aminomethyltransferase n=1 Tax=Schistosoma mekongi TaxID=38744 RepID=A0AAE1ZFE7_SCHME|nr:hypothetical protein MN116_003935 [Schistosoma mekongi]